jgi:hypothetical protein
MWPLRGKESEQESLQGHVVVFGGRASCGQKHFVSVADLSDGCQEYLCHAIRDLLTFISPYRPMAMGQSLIWLRCSRTTTSSSPVREKEFKGPEHILPLFKDVQDYCCSNHLGSGPVIRAWHQEICSVYGLRFESCGCSYDGHWRLTCSLTSGPVGLVEVRASWPGHPY